MITIDARTLTAGIDYNNFFNEYYEGLPGGSSVYHGGEPDSAFGGEYYVSGPEVSFTYGEDSDAMVLLEGADIAYDFIHYGAAYGHGISGEIDEVMFGTADEDTGTEGGTENGLVTGLDVGLRVTGLDISAEPGEGNTPENAVYSFYDATRNGLNVEDGEDHIGYIYDVLGAEGQEFLGSAFGDRYVGTDNDDMARGYSGRDVLIGGRGDDLLKGDGGRDVLRGGAGSDSLLGGADDDRLFGGNGSDVLHGGDGDDFLVGGGNIDRLFGGEGADIFAYLSANDSTVDAADRIMDFESGVDTIDLTRLGTLTLVDEFSGAEGELRLEDGGRYATVEADFSGNGEADFAILVRGGDIIDSDLLFA